MLEDFSKGKNLTVRSSKKRGGEDEDQTVERQFNFIAELSVLVDYEVISKYLLACRHHKLSKQPEILMMTSSFFKRVVFQFKSPWIFFNFETLSRLEDFLSEGTCNNTLLPRGMNNLLQVRTALDKQL